VRAFDIWKNRAGPTCPTVESVRPVWLSTIAEGAAMAHHYSGPDFSFPHGDARVDHCDLFAFAPPEGTPRSVVAIDVHPSFGINPEGPTTTEPFAPEAMYELKVDTNADGAAEVAFRVRVSVTDSAQFATVRRVEGADAAGAEEGGAIIVADAPVSAGSEAQVTEAGEYRFFAGWRSDPFFFDAGGALNEFQFTGDDFFADKDVCSIVLEMPNERWEPRAKSRSGTGRSSRTATATAAGCRWIAEPGLRSPSSSVRVTKRRRTSPVSRRLTTASSTASRMS
jgi:Domain of unknown function (DUF4331)